MDGIFDLLLAITVWAGSQPPAVSRPYYSSTIQTLEERHDAPFLTADFKACRTLYRPVPARHEDCRDVVIGDTLHRFCDAVLRLEPVEVCE